jgi:RNase H-fold protein (predicted Holliday junction resolvase)
MIIAIDPGKLKCGIAVLDSKKVYHMKVVDRDALILHLERFLSGYEIKEIVVGCATGSGAIVEELSKIEPPVKIITISENLSSLEARKRYFQDNPPRGLLRFLPSTMLVPNQPVDDYAAVVLGERYLKG